MSNDKPFDDKNFPPQIIKRLLQAAPVLPRESHEEFSSLYFSFEHYTKPETTPDYLAVYQVTVLTWEVLRYQVMKVALLHNYQRPALDSLLRRTHEGATLKGAEQVVKLDADQRAKNWFRDPASRPAMVKAFEVEGYSSHAVDAMAFERALPALATIERLIVSAQKRLAIFLKGLEKGSEDRAAKLRSAADEAIGKTSNSHGGAQK
jgi:hypothetical protein